MSPSPNQMGFPVPEQERTSLAGGELAGAGSVQAPAQAGAQGAPRDALQALLAFSSLHEQIRRRAREGRENKDRSSAGERQAEQFVLQEVLQLVAERVLAITGATGAAIALAEGEEIICRGAAGDTAPDLGARLNPNSGFTGTCYRTGEIVRCDDAAVDARVDRDACRGLGARSMVAVPLRGLHGVVGVLEAFSHEPYGFTDSDIRGLILLAELILAAMKPEQEDAPLPAAPPKSVGPQPAMVLETLAELLAQRTRATGSAGRDRAIVTSEAAKQAEPEPVHLLETLEKLLAAEQHRIAEPVPLGNPAAARQPQLSEQRPAPKPEPVAVSPTMLSSYQQEERPAGWRRWAVVAAVLVAVGTTAWWWRAPGGRFVVQSAPASDNPVAAVAANPDQPADQSREASSAGGDTALAAGHSPLPQVTGIRHWTNADSTTVVIDLEDQVPYEAHRLNSPERIYFDLHDTTMAPGIAGRTIEISDRLLLRIRMAQPMAGVTRVVLETKGSSNFSVSMAANPYRLVVEVRGVQAPKEPAKAVPQDALRPSTRQPAPLVGAEGAKASPEDLQLRAHVPRMRMVIDAGHGGWDLGTVGREGLLEKDLVLEIAQRLGLLLRERLGTEVVLTRQDDTYISLERRAVIANQIQADLFVSIHANYSSIPTARGVETYYTNSAPNAEVLEGEAREAAGAANLRLSSGRELRVKSEESRRLAAAVQQALYSMLAPKTPGIRNRGVKAAPYVVLTGTNMPAVLAEVSFVSSPTDEQNLLNPAYRQQIAEALYRGIARFAASGNEQTASTSSRSTGQ